MRLRAVAAVGVAALALTGCGRDAGGAEGGPGQGEAIDEGKATGTIEVWAMGTEGEELGEFTAAFEEEHPDAQVEVTAVPWDSAHTKIATAITSGKTPDVALIGTTWMGEFAETGGLEPTPEGLVDEADFFEGAWSSTVVGDTSYGVPWYVETRVLYYRKDLAQKAGWDQAPASWDELKQFATDLEKKAGAEYGISLPPGQTGSWQTMLPFAWSNGATLTDDAGSEYTIDSPETVEALEYYKTYFDEGLSPSRTLDPGELESGFAEGTYGSFVSGPWHTGLVEEKGLSKDDYGLAVLPGPDGDQGTSFVGGGDLAVFSDSDNKESAWKFVQWLAQPEVQSDWYDHMGSLPAVRESWETGALSEDEQLAVFGQQLDTALSPPAVPTWEQVAAVIDAEVEKAAKGTVPVEDAVSTMQEKAQSIGTGL
jgi:multiple sugar transport system substrate-binding protein